MPNYRLDYRTVTTETRARTRKVHADDPELATEILRAHEEHTETGDDWSITTRVEITACTAVPGSAHGLRPEFTLGEAEEANLPYVYLVRDDPTLPGDFTVAADPTGRRTGPHAYLAGVPIDVRHLAQVLAREPVSGESWALRALVIHLDNPDFPDYLADLLPFAGSAEMKALAARLVLPGTGDVDERVQAIALRLDAQGPSADEQ